MNKYILTKNEPCADYDGITIEGRFENTIDIDCCTDILKEKGFRVRKINRGALVLAENGVSSIFIYDLKKIVISKIDNIEMAEKLLRTIIDNAEKEKRK